LKLRIVGTALIRFPIVRCSEFTKRLLLASASANYSALYRAPFSAAFAIRPIDLTVRFPCDKESVRARTHAPRLRRGSCPWAPPSPGLLRYGALEDKRSYSRATSQRAPGAELVLPRVEGEDAYWRIKRRARQYGRLGEDPAYSEIEMPRNSPTGFICAFFATFMGSAPDLAHLVACGRLRIGRIRLVQFRQR
jgi:hypothetical protein